MRLSEVIAHLQRIAEECSYDPHVVLKSVKPLNLDDIYLTSEFQDEDSGDVLVIDDIPNSIAMYNHADSQ